eukprot:2034302-Prymnesium_polylepis.1
MCAGRFEEQGVRVIRYGRAASCECVEDLSARPLCLCVCRAHRHTATRRALARWGWASVDEVASAAVAVRLGGGTVRADRRPRARTV